MLNPFNKSIAPTYLVLCLLFGGASAAGAAANAVVQIVGLVLIVLALWRLRKGDLPRDALPLLWLTGLFVLLVLLHLVPLPPSWWQSLPAREFTARGFELLGTPDPSLPVSLNREGTIASALSIIPPLAIFLWVTRMEERQRRINCWILLIAAGASILLGAFQLAGGPDSSLRFYEITNRMAPVGFFANANHLATLLLCALPFVGFLAANASTSRNPAWRKGGLLLSGTIGLLLTVGLIIIDSLAGYSLFVPVALATVLIYKRAVSTLKRRWVAGLSALLMIFLAFALAGPINQQALSTNSASSRKVIAERTGNAVVDFLPIGSGLGTFQDIYRRYDDPNRTDQTYVNHAHNDYLEIALELGVPGALLVIGFILWWARRTLIVWHRDVQGAHLARTASVVLSVVLLHSLVDYPLRTAAIASIFAMACALLLPPRTPTKRAKAEGSASSGSNLRHLQAE